MIVGTPRRGFTLVELLVVIGIISTLVAILLPALNRVRGSAQSVACQSTLRQVGLGLRMYADANRGYLPPGYYIDPIDAGNSYFWHLAVRGFLAQRGAGNFGTQNGALADFRCPSALLETPKGRNASHYSANPRLMPIHQPGGFGHGLDQLSGRTGDWPTFRYTDIRRSSEMILATDGAQRPLNDPDRAGEAEFTFFNIGTDWAGNMIWVPWAQQVITDQWMRGSRIRWRSTDGIDRNVDGSQGAGFIRFRHGRNDTTNALFVDGHVASYKTRPDGRTDIFIENVAVEGR